MGVSPFDMLPLFGVFGAVFMLVFLLIAGLIAFAIIKSVTRYASDMSQPQVARPARVMTKRENVWGGSGDSSAHTSYYVTFQFADGSRDEYAVGGRQYGLLAEGDVGHLTTQGSRFVSFAREGANVPQA